MNVDLWVVLGTLFVFGWVYDLLIISPMNSARPSASKIITEDDIGKPAADLCRLDDHPFTSLQVAFGTAVTLFFFFLALFPNMATHTIMLYVFACFVASGSPMMYRDMWRWWVRRQQDRTDAY